MGNCGKKISQVFQKRKTSASKIGESTTCPRCGQIFSASTTYQTLNYHIDSCLTNQAQFHNYIQQQILLDPNFGNNQSEKTSNIDSSQVEYFWAKVPIKDTDNKDGNTQQNLDSSVTSSRKTSSGSNSSNNQSNTKYRWERRSYSKQDINMTSLRRMSPKEVSGLTFEKKQIWFREKCEALRIPWTQGADWIKINPDNVLLNSMFGIQQCDLHKEVKIQIIGDKVNDAGGLLREWVLLCMKEILHPNTGMFTVAGTSDVCYKINKEAEQCDHIIDCFKLLGKIIGKTIFERITMDCYFDRSIINYILGKPTNLEDIYFYDSQLYNSWKFLLENKLAEDDFIDVFAVYRNANGTTKTIELIPDGEEILVNNSNKELYVEKQIQYLCVDSVKVFLDAICEEIYKVIPKQYLSVFEAHEFEMILNGVPFINLDEWKQNTEYSGNYSQNNRVIQWFWMVMNEFNQDQLSKFLQYCTGSSRTPVDGFKKLESNRGNYAKFQIKSVPYEKKNPYPKAHTCFNRLELPEYSNLENLRTYMKAIVNNDLDGVYGLE
ncbi:hypothetical protein ABPG74_021256 [Tetrahymena malaccensis]